MNSNNNSSNSWLNQNIEKFNGFLINSNNSISNFVNLLDLNYLSQEERENVFKVIQKDFQLWSIENERIKYCFDF